MPLRSSVPRLSDQHTAPPYLLPTRPRPIPAQDEPLVQAALLGSPPPFGSALPPTRRRRRRRPALGGLAAQSGARGARGVGGVPLEGAAVHARPAQQHGHKSRLVEQQLAAATCSSGRAQDVMLVAFDHAGARPKSCARRRVRWTRWRAASSRPPSWPRRRRRRPASTTSGPSARRSALRASQHGQSGRLGGAISGHHGPIRLHPKARGYPPHSRGEAQPLRSRRKAVALQPEAVEVETFAASDHAGLVGQLWLDGALQFAAKSGLRQVMMPLQRLLATCSHPSHPSSSHRRLRTMPPPPLRKSDA